MAYEMIVEENDEFAIEVDCTWWAIPLRGTANRERSIILYPFVDLKQPEVDVVPEE